MMEGPDQAYAQNDMYADIMKPSTESTGPLEYKSYTTVHPKSIEQQEKEAKISASLDQQQPGKEIFNPHLNNYFSTKFSLLHPNIFFFILLPIIFFFGFSIFLLEFFFVFFAVTFIFILCLFPRINSSSYVLHK